MLGEQKEKKPQRMKKFLLDVTFPVYYSAAAAKSLQSCPTLCDPRDGSPPGSPVPGILQARTLEWVVISFSGLLFWDHHKSTISTAASHFSVAGLNSIRVSSSNSAIRRKDSEEKGLPCIYCTLCFRRFRLLLQDECLSHFLTGLINPASALV